MSIDESSMKQAKHRDNSARPGINISKRDEIIIKIASALIMIMGLAMMFLIGFKKISPLWLILPFAGVFMLVVVVLIKYLVIKKKN